MTKKVGLEALEPVSEFDVVILGSGAGGATLLHQLVNVHSVQNKRILVVEKGPWLPHETTYTDPLTRADDLMPYRSPKWRSNRGRFQPAINYGVGGNTNHYAACMFRFRESDFEERRYFDGYSPAWPIGYDDLKDYYYKAETLFHVRGNRGEDPTEPADDRPYPLASFRHERSVQLTHDRMGALQDWTPFHLPMGVVDNLSPGTFDPLPKGKTCPCCQTSPCRVTTKAQADELCIKPAMESPNVTLVTGVSAREFLSNSDETKVDAVVLDDGAKRLVVKSKLFVLAAGAANSAEIMLRSKGNKGTSTLANENRLVGANYMYHLHSFVMLVDGDLADEIYPKTLGFNDYYERRADVPLRKEIAGTIQNVGRMDASKLAEYSGLGKDLRRLARKVLNGWGKNNLSFIISTEDLPLPENRITLRKNSRGEFLHLNYKKTNVAAHRRLTNKFRSDLAVSMRTVLPQDEHPFLFGLGFAVDAEIPGSGNAHQCGTMGMGHDAKSSVCDSDCRVWGLDNLYVADGSVFTSSAAVNPSLTIIANAMRVGDNLAKRL